MTTKPKKRAPKVSRPEQIRNHIDAFLATGKEIENLRDIWYSFKGDIEHIKHKPDSEWDTYVNEHIGSYLFKLYLAGDTEIYHRLNIITTGLSGTGYEDNTPIVLFSEKRTRSFIQATEALLCGRYESVGQIPSFEAVNIAEYLVDTALHDYSEVYLIALTDFDPAGVSIYNSLSKKVEQSIALLNPTLKLVSYSIPYGKDYDDAIANNVTYTLGTSLKNKLNQVWINTGRPLGIELNVLPDKDILLEDAILELVDPSIVEALSLGRAKTAALRDALDNDTEYQQLIRQLEARRQELELPITTSEHIFSNIWATSITIKSVREMTVLIPKDKE